MPYHNVQVIDKIHKIKKLLDICSIAYGDIEDKDKIMCVLLDFLEPALDEIIYILEIKEEKE